MNEIIRRHEIHAIEKKYAAGEIFLVEMIDYKFANKLYVKEHLSEFMKFCEDNKDFANAPIYTARGKFPNNEIIHDLCKFYEKQKNWTEKYFELGEKKNKEYMQLFWAFNKTLGYTKLSIMEIYEYYKFPSSEENGQWDFVNHHDKIAVEYSNLTSAGSLTSKIQKQMNSKDTEPIFEPIEIFNETLRIMKRKMAKKKHDADFFHRFVLDVYAFGDASGTIVRYATRQSKYRDIEKYIFELKMICQKMYFDFYFGEIVLVYGEQKTNYVIIPIQNYYANFDKAKYGKNDTTLLVSSIGFDSPEMNIKMEEYIERARKNDKNKIF